MPSPKTTADYEREWSRFVEWAETQSASPLPAAPDLVAAYLQVTSSSASDSAPSLGTVRRIKAAIDHMHDEAGHSKPSKSAEVKRAWNRIRRRRTARRRLTGEVDLDEVLTNTQREMITAQPPTPTGTRDRALLALGFGAGLRPAEVVRLTTVDVGIEYRIEVLNQGRVVRVRSVIVRLPEGGKVLLFSPSKGLDPAGALSEWSDIAGLNPSLRNQEESNQALFRGLDRHGNVSDKRLTLAGLGVVVRRAAELAGLDDPASYTPSTVFTERLAEGNM